MKKAKRILVGLKTLDQAKELTDVACRLAAPGALLLLCHIIELPDVTPLDAEVPDLESAAAKILLAGERVANRNEFKVSTAVLRAHDSGSALIDEMQEKKADLGVFGYHHKLTVGEFFFGTAAQSIAKHAPCHVVFMVPPIA